MPIRPRTNISLVALASMAACLMGCSEDFSSSDSNTGNIQVTVSGEELAVDGFSFPTGSEVVLSDGWEMEFSHILVAIDHITLSKNPDKMPSDQSQTGPVVAEQDGPWVVDVHRPGSVPNVGGEGKAVPLVSFDNQNQNGNAPFATDERYAFGYDLVALTEDAIKVNLEDDQESDDLVKEMIDQGYSVLYAGTARFVGTDCQSSDDAYDFSRLPEEVPFTFGFDTPVSNINCQNQENQGDPFDGEEYQRGIPIKSNQASVAQITLHVEHPFFSDVQHDPTLYFDQFAAQLVGADSEQQLGLGDLEGVDPTAFTDAEGNDLPWRVCDGSSLPDNPVRSFGVGSVPVDPQADPQDALRDYRDYVRYVQSTQGHLNGGEGLCFVQRNYPSPP